MKEILFISFIFFTAVVFGQSSDYNITPVQAGTVALVNGKATISLDENTIVSLSASNGSQKNTYFVMLTPIGNCGQLKLNEKGDKSFTVAKAGSGSDNGSFDYIVFLKYSLIPLNQNIQPLKLAPHSTSK